MLPSSGSSEDMQPGSSKLPAFKQHFVWEPIGYVPSIVLPDAQSQPISNTKSTPTYGGEYSMDKVAMKRAIMSIPIPRNAIAPENATCDEHLTQQNATLTNTDIALAAEFSEEPSCTKDDSKHAADSSQSQPKKEEHGFKAALSSTVVVMDLKLGVNPKKELSFARTAVGFLVGIVRENALLWWATAAMTRQHWRPPTLLLRWSPVLRWRRRRPMCCS